MKTKITRVHVKADALVVMTGTMGRSLHPAAALGVAVPWDDQAAMFSLIGETVMTGSFLVGSAGSCDLVIGRGDILSLLTSEQDL